MEDISTNGRRRSSPPPPKNWKKETDRADPSKLNAFTRRGEEWRGETKKRRKGKLEGNLLESFLFEQGEGEGGASFPGRASRTADAASSFVGHRSLTLHQVLEAEEKAEPQNWPGGNLRKKRGLLQGGGQKVRIKKTTYEGLGDGYAKHNRQSAKGHSGPREQQRSKKSPYREEGQETWKTQLPKDAGNMLMKARNRKYALEKERKEATPSLRKGWHFHQGGRKINPSSTETSFHSKSIDNVPLKPSLRSKKKKEKRTFFRLKS